MQAGLNIDPEVVSTMAASAVTEIRWETVDLSDLSDLLGSFGSFFGRGGATRQARPRPERGADLEARVFISFDDALSGAQVREAISWGKVKETAKTATLYAEATAVLPLIVSYALTKLGR